MLDLYEETIDKGRYMAKRSLPLHRNLRMCINRREFAKPRSGKLKVELQPFKEKVAKRNLDILAKVATRRSTRKR
jgi:hypothetical protein